MRDERSDHIAVRRKRLRFRAQRRGFKEADLVFGGFAEAWLERMDERELDQFQSLLDASEHDVFAWIRNERPVPATHDTPVLARMKEFCRRTSPTWNV